MDYKLSDFDYKLPLELIAQEPAEPRDSCRLLFLDKETGEVKHQKFWDILDYLKEGDVLVLNDSKVFPARLFGKKQGTGGAVEIFLHKNVDDYTWECLIGGRVRPEMVIELDKGLEALVVKDNADGTFTMEFNKKGTEFFGIINEIGHLPLPPYIKREGDNKEDQKNYQTSYANDNKVGSVAAPTAGLHFTPELLEKIQEKGIRLAYVTLHVGLGTFSPIKTENIIEHKMHSEYAQMDQETSKLIKEAKSSNHRIIAVGTTSSRVLESWANKGFEDNFGQWTDIFIYPGYKFKVVDGLITNFHLPKSSLMLLVSALAGKKNIDKAYQEAISLEYRFFSYGDAMIII